MAISTRGRYAVRAMLELALRHGRGPVLTREIARAQGISRKYLERLLRMLRVAGLVRSRRGRHGGFTLARPSEKITILDILTVMEGTLAPVACVEQRRSCKRSARCAARRMWAEIAAAHARTLRGITLGDFARLHHDCTSLAAKTHRN